MPQMSNSVPRTFRAVMQRIGLSNIKNSPVRRVEKAAVKQVQSQSTLSQRAAQLGGSAAEATSSSPSSPREQQAATAVEQLRARLYVPAGITDTLREKGQEAMRQATDKAIDLLETARESAKHRSTSTYFAKTSFDVEQAYKQLQEAVRENKRHYHSRTPFDDRWDDILSSLAVLGRVSTGNKVTPYRDSGEAYLDMWKAIDGAEKEVLWQTYICKDDHVGQTTVQKIARARKERQCEAELLYDCGGNISGRTRLMEDLRKCGVNVIVFRPFFWSFFAYVLKGFDWKISPGLRNHRKILLVDGKIGFCGGLNVGNEYCGPQAGGNGKFRDTHCSVVGPAVQHLREVYDDTKQPTTWKYGWARWRQIATKRLNHQYQTSRSAVEEGVVKRFQDATAEMKRSGGSVYFSTQLRKAQANTNQALSRLRWQKQAMQLKKNGNGGGLKVAYRSNGDRNEATLAASTTVSEEELERRSCGNAAAQEAAAPCRETGNESKKESFPPPNPDSEDIGVSSASTASTEESGSTMRANATHRKVMEARIRALYNATDLPHKRSYTNLLLQLPIADEEPVPEAEMYCMRRPPCTQIISCNPRYYDYSIQFAFWQVTRKCHRRIWITTPYYLPTKKLFRAMLHAASRGVDVRILAGSNQTTDPWFMWHASNYITEKLLRGGVKVYEFKGSQIMHAKTVVADSVWCSIGSYNWDVMSNKNLEVCLCQFDRDTAREMERQFLQDLSMSEEVKLEDHQQRSLWLRFTSWLFYNFVYVLDRITFRSFSNQDLEDSAGTHRD